ncbi:MAG: hypothetical protein AB8B55_12685 [Mariniblastus sp.]
MSNPFKSPSSTEPVSAERLPNNSLANHISRVLFVFFFFGLFPVFIAPNFMAMFDEFGVELPVVLQWAFTYCELFNQYAFIGLPAILLGSIALEVLLRKFTAGRTRATLNLLLWLLLITSVAFCCLALFNTLDAISSGLAA